VHRYNTLEENNPYVSDCFDVILTNPPFGGTENIQIQMNYEVKSNATELLFTEHIMKKLDDHDEARCAMVVPEGTLFRGGAFATVKKKLLTDFKLLMVMSLPPGTFAPYSDVKTALLFFKRPGPTTDVLYYEMPLADGLKRFSKRRPIADKHFAEALEAWEVWKAYSEGRAPFPVFPETSWIETFGTLVGRGYDLTAKNPNEPEDERVPDPAELTAKFLEHLHELQAIMERVHEAMSSKESVL
jgi:type I restriction enzyme M protein